MRTYIETFVDSLDICLPDNIPNCDNLTTDQKMLLIAARTYVDCYYEPENRKHRIMLDAFHSILKAVGEENFKELATSLREFMESKICAPCDSKNENQDCENCHKIDWTLRDMRLYVELE